jgi:hypothetical protein
MAAIGWIWAWLMLLGGVRAHLDHQLAPGFAGAMIVSGLIALPVLWHRENGVLRGVAPSGLVRAGLSLMVLVMAGITYPGDALGLVPGLA